MSDDVKQLLLAMFAYTVLAILIGAGAWLSESLQPGTMVLQVPPRHVHRSLDLPSSPNPSTS